MFSSFTKKITNMPFFGAKGILRLSVKIANRRTFLSAGSSESKVADVVVHPPSAEQIEIVNAVLPGDVNIQVNAVAGSGK